MNPRYGFGREVTLPFDEAIARVTAELQKEGFGVLTEIDVAATLHKKLGVTLPSYRILGACNPALAHQALTAEPSVGLLMPCNVVVRQTEAGRVVVELLDPVPLLALAENPALATLSATVREKLERVLAAL